MDKHGMFVFDCPLGFASHPWSIFVVRVSHVEPLEPIRTGSLVLAL